MPSSSWPRAGASALALALAACGGADLPPPAAAPHAPRGPAIAYRLPVVGRWRVLRTHYGAKNDQAYAVDLVVDGPARGDGRQNSDYASYAQPVVADGPGTVVVAVDGVPENTPGVVNRYEMHGNFVVIDHHNGEYSLFCHFIPGTVRVHPGQDVAAGTELGRCGNSGHSTLPHLHWQVMTDASPSLAKGLPPRLLPYLKNGAASASALEADDVIVAR